MAVALLLQVVVMVSMVDSEVILIDWRRRIERNIDIVSLQGHISNLAITYLFQTWAE